MAPRSWTALTGLGRHGVITKVTVSVIEIDKHSTYWRNDATYHRTMEEFIDVSRGLCANPPADARFLRGLGVDFPLAGGRRLGWAPCPCIETPRRALSRRASEAAAYGTLHRLGWMAGRLPAGIDKAVTRRHGRCDPVSALRDGEEERGVLHREDLDATVGDPQLPRGLSPIERYEEQFRRLWELLTHYRDAFDCFTFLSLYVKSIDSPYLAQGDPDNRRWVEFLFYVGINPEMMTETLLDRIADDLDQNCIDTGSFRYMHTRTGRDPQRLAAIDPNAHYNGGVSVHPLDRPLP